MNAATLLLLGAAGGAVRGIVHAYDCMTEWLNGRQQYRLDPDSAAEGPPAFRAFYDIGGESIAAVVHTLLGALVAGLLGMSGQISGGFAVFAAGASAPLVLVQLKSSRLADVVLGEGTPSTAANPTQSADAATNEPVLRSTRNTTPTQRTASDSPSSLGTDSPPASRPSSPPGAAHRPAADEDGTG
ncbi:hypothetical protein [Streptomyces fructofermentans]|uniref:Uncharacterized protein n=1 Tax=Streptomyces fructofermentans TaxID=152141 RepID=A0A918U558_9ACTN|nr:hypothetical protein [Streptomyces fructofermentans]GGX94070.1 hypothetical protein GCM10010515_71220 [Streptomyces fructofermentans]